MFVAYLVLLCSCSHAAAVRSQCVLLACFLALQCKSARCVCAAVAAFAVPPIHCGTGQFQHAARVSGCLLLASLRVFQLPVGCLVLARMYSLTSERVREWDHPFWKRLVSVGGVVR